MAEVERVVVAFAEAWNRHDMEEFPELFAPDAEFVNVVGKSRTVRRCIEEDNVITTPAVLLCAVFVALAAVHVYWAFGGGQGLGSAVPTRGGAPVFIPGRAATVLVAVALLAAAVVSVWRTGALTIGPAWIPRVGIWVIAVVFAVRAVGDFHYCGFFKRARDTAFARYDTFVYSPLCVVIAALAVWLSAGG